MIGMGTNVYGVLFGAAVLIFAILIMVVLVRLWSRYYREAEQALKKKEFVPAPNVAGPIIVTVLAVTSFIVITTLAWNFLQTLTTNMSTYQSPDEVTEQEAVQESQLPPPEQLNQTRQEQKERAQVQPHRQALSDYDAAMEREAQKIKQRNQAPQPTAQQ
ncbi:MAG: hypothetical protein A2951_01225 [Candidatus Buchananbacteria bacterium RIFCSPLOWO2_01_FULL_56_15]|uniref:Uncharacterized protein n=2 Tax=Candidatus Buchananiibacteriota TaxID=1817903 RepID=A0A1G1YIP7_9BACT|nr:MAG: hypothetical protein A3J59_04365 [Candidatus Buchananbacteria bacterium RIFCSPHIGHO2_02_FULL_56_16]OGY54680.1 MAG: hypothetical protein A2951_01225 [Candidatus Buchananbacteria bacterium RIFCSPLOWO2_01_FULL_56_15]